MKIIVNLGVLCFALGISFAAYSQDRTYTHSRDYGMMTKPCKILLVPYEEKMFLSDITRNVALHHDMEVQEVKEGFRAGICQLFTMESGGDLEVYDLLSSGEEGADEDLNHIYAINGYSYEIVPPLRQDQLAAEEPEKSLSGKMNKAWGNIKAKFPKDEAPKQNGRGTNIEGGEVKTQYDSEERFMDVVFSDPELLPYLQEKYQYDFVIFINQLDIKNTGSTQDRYGHYSGRKIKIHYTIYDGPGKRVGGGATSNLFEQDQYDMFYIMKEHLEPAVQTMIKEVVIINEEQSSASSNHWMK